MAGLYEKFMSAGSVKSLMSGKEIRKAAQNEQTPSSGSELAGAFGQKPADCSLKRVKALKRLVGESSFGQSVLDEAQKGGVRIMLDDEMTDGSGFFDPEQNVICLNAKESDAALASTLIHESRHAWQERQGVRFDAELKVDSFMMAGFAMEADAVATEARFAYEMRPKHPEIWESLLDSRYAAVAKGFEKGVKETHMIGDGLNRAFSAWFTTPVVPLYADDYVDCLCDLSRKSCGEQHSFLSRDVSSRQIAAAYCRSGKDVYLKDPDMLAKPETLHLSPEQKQKLDTALTEWAERTHRSGNVGSEAVFVKEKDGSYSAGKKLNVRQTAKKQLWMQNMKAGGRS